MAQARIAVIGDFHSAWDDADVDYFNSSSYELLLFTGDLGASGPRDGVRIARSLARLQRPALVIPGNNDVAQYGEIAAELTYRRVQVALLEDDASEAVSGRGQVRVCGLSAHRFELSDGPLTVIAGRPFAMGGDELSFPTALERSFGVRTLAESTERLRALVERHPAGERLIVLAHNGPTGLGAERDAIWGCDFRPQAGDWGDSDVTAAIAHAHARGTPPLAVIAGHMHWSLKGGGKRCVQVERDGTLYLNAARVPRIYAVGGTSFHHHAALFLDDGRARVEHVLVPVPAV